MKLLNVVKTATIVKPKTPASSKADRNIANLIKPPPSTLLYSHHL